MCVSSPHSLKLTSSDVCSGASFIVEQVGVLVWARNEITLTTSSELIHVPAQVLYNLHVMIIRLCKLELATLTF